MMSSDYNDGAKGVLASSAPRTSSNHLRSLLDAATELAIFSFLPDGMLTFFNTGAERLLGYPAEDVVGKLSISDLLNRNEPVRGSLSGDNLVSVLVAGLTPQKGVTKEWRYIRKNGGLRVLKMHISMVLPEEHAREYLAIAEDITDQAKVAAELERNRKMLSLVIDCIPSPVFYKDADGYYIDCNAAFSAYLGLPKDKIIGKSVFDVAPADLAKVYHEADLALMQSRAKQVYEAKVRYADDSVRDVVFYKATLEEKDVGTVHGLVGMMLDFTERKAAEQALRKSEEELRMIFETSQAGIILVDNDGRIIRTNPRMAEMLRLEPCEILGMRYPDFLHPEDKAYGEDSMNALASGGTDHVYIERRYRRGDGSDFWGLISGRRIMNADASLQALVGIIIDITEAKEVRQALEEERERLRVTLQSIGDGVVAVDTGGRVVLLNAVAENLCGWTQQDAAGRDLTEIFDIYNEITKAPVPNPVTHALATGSIVELANHTVLVAKDGTERPIEDSAAPIRNEKGELFGAVLVFRDVSEKKAIQEELFRNRKLESLGVLAGGIAHDFNNLLTGIMGNVSVASRILPQDHRTQQLLQRALKGVDRAAELTMQLVTFAKGGAPIKKVTSIAEIITESARFALRGSNVECKVDIAEGLWPVEVDPGQLSQVINNLVINADQAMPDGGRLIIRAENLPHRRNSDTRQVRITVTDNGVGIPKENLQRIFDPYFTTKDSGSGLGLATVYSIIRNHDGDIRVTSTEEGTTFYFTLPAYGGQPERTEAPDPPVFEGEGRVLVIDDEEEIRCLVAEALSLLGYTPTVCSEGCEAINEYKKAIREGNRFNAVIMDLTIPGGMGGKDAARYILDIDPMARIIVSSGYSNDPVIASYDNFGFCGYLLKPYSVASLAAAVKEATS